MNPRRRSADAEKGRIDERQKQGMDSHGSIPEETMIAIANVAQHISGLEEKLSLLLLLLESPDIIQSLSPLHRAGAFLSISKSLNTLFTGMCLCFEASNLRG